MSIVSVSSSPIYLRSTIQSHRHGSKLNLSHLLLHRTQSLSFPATNRSSHITISRDMAVCSGDGFESPPSLPENTPWPLWLAGLVLPAILSIWKTKNSWAPFLMLKQKVEDVVDAVEDVAEMVETAAEKVDKMAEEVAEHLPEGSKLKNVVRFIENTAETIAKDADFAGDIIDKVEEMEDEVSLLFKQYGENKEEDANQKNDQTQVLPEQSKEQPLK